MKKLMLTFAALALLFSACRKDEDVTDIDLQIPDSEEIAKVDALGIVTDENGNTLAATTVQLYDEKGELLGETTTDATGHFEIKNLDAPHSKLLVFAEKPDFHATARKVEPSPAEMGNIHLQMTSVPVYPEEMGTLMPSDTTLISLEGKVLDGNGDPASVLILVVIDGNLFYLAMTDADGNYQVFAKAGKPIVFAIYQGCVDIATGFPMGPFFEDQVLNDFELNTLESYTISGTLTDCDGNPVTNGYAEIEWTGNLTTSAWVNSDGEFSLTISDCQPINPTITIVGYDVVAGNLSNPVEIPFNEENIDAGTISVCTPNDTYVAFGVDGDIYAFFPVSASIAQDSILDPVTGQVTYEDVTTVNYQSADGQSYMIMQVAGVGEGTYPIKTLLIYKFGDPIILPVTFDPPQFTVECTFTVFENQPGGVIEGHFSGNFVDLTGQRMVEGAFKARQ